MKNATAAKLSSSEYCPDAMPENKPRVIRALILDDSNFDRKRLRRIARQTGVPIEIKDCASLIAFRKYLDVDEFQIVFIDYRLPEGDGLEALDILENHHINANATPILIAGDLSADVIASAFKQGCSSYIAKSKINTKTLRYTILSSLAEKTEEDSDHIRRMVRVRPCLHAANTNRVSIRSHMDDNVIGFPT